MSTHKQTRQPIKKDKVQTGFRLQPALIHALKIQAKKQNRSLNNYVETILYEVISDETSYLLADEENRARLMEGIKQANEGKTTKIDIDAL
ncbi:MAG: toxin-antitoxin system HicB family antitoxin [Flavobacteriaceae bacterium]|jgi:hypothetical protein|nr:toxin-antitoxin system HicB family antitoxin [Flavobacteriaceae bacterium]